MSIFKRSEKLLQIATLAAFGLVETLPDAFPSLSRRQIALGILNDAYPLGLDGKNVSGNVHGAPVS